MLKLTKMHRLTPSQLFQIGSEEVGACFYVMPYAAMPPISMVIFLHIALRTA